MFVPKRQYRPDEDSQTKPFLRVDANYWINQENKVTIVDIYKMSISDTIIQLDDEFLVNIAWSLGQVTSLFDDKTSGVHPLFMKDSICDLKND